MASGAWSYFATTLDGSGGDEMLSRVDLPLADPSITEALSGADGLTAKIDPEYPELVARDGQPVLVPWKTAVYAELDGAIRFGGILRSLKASGPTLTLDVVGFVGYLEKLPWTNSTIKLYGADPAEVMRMIWKYAQQHDGGMLGVRVSEDVKSTAKLGRKVIETTAAPKPTTTTSTTKTKTETKVVTTAKKVVLLRDGNVVTTTTTTKITDAKTKKVETTVREVVKTTKTDLTVTTVTKATDAAGKTTTSTTSTKLKAGAKISRLVDNVTADEPYVLARYETHDLLQAFNDAAAAGSIDYRESHTWANDGQTIHHDIVLGYPRLGRRRTDIAFMVGVNVEQPDCDLDVEDYASEVLVIGAGEGDKMVTGWAANGRATRLRRVAVVPSKGIGRAATANAAAVKLASRYNSLVQDVTELVVHDHPAAPLGSWERGDEVYLDGDAGWGGELGQWVRILSTTYSPLSSANTATLTVARADKVST